MDEKLVRQAEDEMRRSAPDVPARPRKKRRANAGSKTTVEAGRYDYEGLDDISGEIKGFIISCVYERHRSAMAEFMDFVGDYLPITNPNAPKHIIFESDDEQEPDKSQERQKEPEGDGTKGKEANDSKPETTEAKDSHQKNKEDEDSTPRKNEAKNSLLEEKGLDKSNFKEMQPHKGISSPSVRLRPVKISCQGVIFFKIEGWESLPIEKHPRNVVKKMLDDLDTRGRLMHCQRIFPVEGVCEMKEDSLRLVVNSIITNFKNQESEEFMKGLDTFAVVFKTRGNQKSKDLDRMQAIHLLAAEMEKMFPQQMKVDLKKPKVALMVEGIPTAKSYVGCMSVVDHRLLSYGSKLGVKPTGFFCEK